MDWSAPKTMTPEMMNEPTRVRMITADAAARRVVVLAIASESAVWRPATHNPPATIRLMVINQWSGESGPCPRIVYDNKINNNGPMVTIDKIDVTATAFDSR